MKFFKAITLVAPLFAIVGYENSEASTPADIEADQSSTMVIREIQNNMSSISQNIDLNESTDTSSDIYHEPKVADSGRICTLKPAYQFLDDIREETTPDNPVQKVDISIEPITNPIEIGGIETELLGIAYESGYFDRGILLTAIVHEKTYSAIHEMFCWDSELFKRVKVLRVVPGVLFTPEPNEKIRPFFHRVFSTEGRIEFVDVTQYPLTNEKSRKLEYLKDQLISVLDKNYDMYPEFYTVKIKGITHAALHSLDDDITTRLAQYIHFIIVP